MQLFEFLKLIKFTDVQPFFHYFSKYARILVNIAN